MEESLQSLLTEYQELNSSFVSIASYAPSPVDFLRHVARNSPLLISAYGQRNNVQAMKWTKESLIEKMGDKKVSVAVTRDGRADSVKDGLFVEPAEIKMTVEELFSKLLPSASPDSSQPVYYLQSQSDNTQTDCAALAADIQFPDFAKNAFGKNPDATNVWIGDSRSRTSAHMDRVYENLYLVVSGTKTFVLLPPHELYALHENDFPSARETFDEATGEFGLEMGGEQTVPWIPVDVEAPKEELLEKWPRYKFARPSSVTLRAGDMLYLPAGWIHAVSQKEDPTTGMPAIAINWWIDRDMEGSSWSTFQFTRRLTLLVDGRTESGLPASPPRQEGAAIPLIARIGGRSTTDAPTQDVPMDTMAPDSAAAIQARLSEWEEATDPATEQLDRRTWGTDSDKVAADAASTEARASRALGASAVPRPQDWDSDDEEQDDYDYEGYADDFDSSADEDM